MPEAGLNVAGLQETKQALEALGIKTEKKIIRKGLRAGAKIVQAACQSEAPKLTGFMASKIKVRSGKAGKGKLAVTVGVGAKDFKGDAFYGAFVEYGHRVGSRRLGDKRKLVPANNFLERGAQASAQSAIDAATQVWNDEIQKAAGEK